ncbi:MAG: PEGA domain-containing protein [Cyanobacteria bacterium]|nr:PEGA domain-containing protein [Cyanobacteriota bacterium]
MTLRVVAIPLFAAICLASPVLSSGEQAKKGRGYSPRGGGGGETATRSGGGDSNRGSGTSSRRSGDGARTASTNNRPSERRASRPAEPRPTSDRTVAGERYAVPRNSGAIVNTAPRNATRRDVRGNDDRNAYYRVVRNDWPRINVNIGGRGHYAPVHYDYWARRYYRWSPIGYAPWSLIYGSIGFPNYGFYGGIGPSPFYYGYNGSGYNYGSPYGGGYPAYAYPHIAGSVRLKIRPRDAQVFVDGYYAGLVDDFDGVFQSLKLEAGGHKIEIRMPGFEDLTIDVSVQPGRTITLEEFLQPRP